MAKIKGFSVQRPKVYIKYWKGPEEEIHTQTPSQNYHYTHTHTHTPSQNYYYTHTHTHTHLHRTTITHTHSQSKREVFGSWTAPNLHSKDLVVWIPKQGARTKDELFMAALCSMSAAPLDEMIFMKSHGQGQLKWGGRRLPAPMGGNQPLIEGCSIRRC